MNHNVYICPYCSHKNKRPLECSKVNCDGCCKTFDTAGTLKSDFPDGVCGSCVHREACKVILGKDYDDAKGCDRVPGRWRKG
jgi:hypothetical protein